MESKDKIDGIFNIFEKFGRYQLVQYLFIFMPIVFISMNMVNYVFVAGDVGYRCHIPECESATPTYNVSWWPSDLVHDRCSMPVFNGIEGNSCTNENFSNITKCERWVYESNETIVGELNLACQPWKVNSIGMIHNFGLALSMVIAGWFSDRYGRKPVFIICSICCCIGNLKTLTTSYYTYASIEFIEALFSGGAYAAANVLMLEIAGKHRILAGVLFAYAIYMGEALFACLAMLIKYWKNLIYILCSPPIIFLSYVFIIKESPRWQILNRKITSAKSTMTVISEMNKIDISKEEINNMNEEQLRNILIGDSKQSEGFTDIIKSREILKNIAIAFYSRFTVSFIYYGLIVNSVLLPGDKYTNFLLAACMSFPGELISMFFMNRYGRKLPLSIGFLICGAACVGCGFVPNSYIAIKITLFLIGKFITSACYTGLVTFTMELFPTSVRGSLIGLCTLAACAGTTAAPLSLILSSHSAILTSVCFGCTAALASFLLIFTPETKDLPLIDTIGQLEKLKQQGKVNPVFDGHTRY